MKKYFRIACLYLCDGIAANLTWYSERCVVVSDNTDKMYRQRIIAQYRTNMLTCAM